MIHHPKNTLRHLAITLAVLSTWGVAQAQSGTKAPGDETRWYASGAIGANLHAGGGGSRTQLGLGVNINAAPEYGRGDAYSLAVGKEFRHDREKEEPIHTRLEVEAWIGDFKRDRVTLSSIQARPGDKIKAQALFLNGLVRFATSENYRWWIGAGIGHAKVDVPSAYAATPGCQCLNAVNTEGTAWRAKLVVERPVSRDSAVFSELGYVKLPGGSSAGIPSTTLGHIGVTHLNIGWRERF